MVFLVNLARVVFAPLLSEFIDVFHVGEATAGLVVSAVWVGSALTRVPTGWLLTRVPRHRVVLWTGGFLTATSVATAAAPNVTLLAVGALCMGLSSGVYFVAANPLVSELYAERVGRAMGLHGTASQIAAVAAAPLVTLLLAVFLTWRAAFLAIALGAFVSTAAFWAASRRTSLPTAGAADRDLLGAVRTEWRIILLGVALLGCTGFVWQGLFNFYALYMTQKGLGPAWSKNMLTVVFAAGVPAFLLGGRLADRLPHVPYMLGILVAFVAAILALTVTTGLLPLLAVTAVLGYVMHSMFPALDTFLLDSLPDERRGSAYAVYSGSMMVVQATGSFVVGALVERGFTYDVVFTALALGLAVLGGGLFVLLAVGRLPVAANPV